MKTIIIAALFMAIAIPAIALDYSCSPLAGACTPMGSAPSVPDYFDTYING